MVQRSAGSVMIVDDDPLILDSVSMLLGSQGFAVSVYSDGHSALEAFRSAPPDVVLTDVNMPVINGFRLMEQIRAFDPDTPIVFITGNAEFDVALSAIKLQAFEFI